MLHFDSKINDAINTPSDHVSTATIENTFKGYSYANNTFHVDLDLQPLIGDIHEISLDIGHDNDMRIQTLYATMNVIDVLNVKLNANLKTYTDAQGLQNTITNEKNNPYEAYVEPNK